MIFCTMGREDDGEEGADVDQLQDEAQTPGERETESNREGEENIAAHGGDLAGVLAWDVRLVGL